MRPPEGVVPPPLPPRPVRSPWGHLRRRWKRWSRRRQRWCWQQRRCHRKARSWSSRRRRLRLARAKRALVRAPASRRARAGLATPPGAFAPPPLAVIRSVAAMAPLGKIGIDEHDTAPLAQQ